MNRTLKHVSRSVMREEDLKAMGRSGERTVLGVGNSTQGACHGGVPVMLREQGGGQWAWDGEQQEGGNETRVVKEMGRAEIL